MNSTITIPFYKSLGGRLLVALTLVTITTVITLGSTIYLTQKAAFEAQVRAQLTSLADLRKEQLVTWLDERQADVRLLAINKLNQDHLTQILTTEMAPAHKAEFTTFLTDNFIGLQQSRKGYTEVAFTDISGTVIIATNPALVGQPTLHQKIFDRTLASTEGKFIEDIHPTPLGDGNSMSFGHVVRAIDLETGEELPDIIGIVYTVVNMEDTIYPLIRVWSDTGMTGETLLVRAEDDRITRFLNDLRFDADAALTLSLPL
ncbi:MAG: hypothetical protein AAF485_05545, partial [Chloroflexota bacterium]